MNAPPNRIPSHLADEYTLGNSIPVDHWYFDDSGAFGGRKYDLNEFYKMISDARNGGVKNYPQTDSLLHDAFKAYSIENKLVVIMGSGNPWYEAMALAYGCSHCCVIEYQKRELKHPKVTYFTVEEYASSKMKFDCAISISSFEHDGLGRYGDPLNPAGDLEAMKKMKNILKEDGLLYLAVPTGKDKLVWNAHRIYGNVRLPLLLDGWELVSTFGDPMLDVDTGKNAPSQPLFILKNYK